MNRMQFFKKYLEHFLHRKKNKVSEQKNKDRRRLFAGIDSQLKKTSFITEKERHRNDLSLLLFD